MTSGTVRLWLQLEGLVVLVVAVVVYAELGASWWVLALLLLVPDIAMAGYLAGPKVGAATYNVVHSYVGPLVLVALTYFLAQDLAYLAIIWIAHIGMDRALGFGLKYDTGFSDTHLYRLGKKTGQPD